MFSADYGSRSYQPWAGSAESKRGHRPAVRAGAPSAARSLVLPWIDDNRKVLHRELGEGLGPMPRASIEKQGIARRHGISPVSVPVVDLAREHVDELDAGVAELGIGLRTLAERDQVGLDGDLTLERMAEEIVE